MEERKLSLSSPPTGTSSRHEGMPDNPLGDGMSFQFWSGERRSEKALLYCLLLSALLISANSARYREGVFYKSHYWLMTCGTSQDAFPGGTLPCILLLYSLQSLLNRGIKDQKTFLFPYSIKKEISWSSLFASNSFTLLVLTKKMSSGSSSIELSAYAMIGLQELFSTTHD
ncbi:hypothetical protein HAX54_038992 [Datura stramonium]|uniref:Uncharacterized protein n=1 Tax=Datura stramonium TaxID=4076 RepID=A0ABS8VKK5_DATST|nr:hypothetical protein [Datura stramonium]